MLSRAVNFSFVIIVTKLFAFCMVAFTEAKLYQAICFS